MNIKHISAAISISLSVFFAIFALFALYPTRNEIASLVERDYKHYYEYEIKVEDVKYTGNSLYSILYDKDGAKLHATYNYAVPTLCLKEEPNNAKSQNQASLE